MRQGAEAQSAPRVAAVLAPARPRVALVMPELLGDLVALTLDHIDCEIAVERTPLAAVAGAAASPSADTLLVDLDASPDGGPRGRAVSIVGLTRRWTFASRLQALSRGIDELVHVPFTTDEIVLRTLVALRRATEGDVGLRARSTVGRFEIDILEGSIRLNGQSVRLTVLEQTLLYLFLAHPGRILERDEILATIWGEQRGVTSNVIDRHIRDLRVKLQERWRDPHLIETVPGMGYRFIGMERAD